MARRLGLLPQTSTAPDGITVEDLVSRGRHPYQRLLRQWSREDDRAVREAMAQTAVDDLAERLVDELSGGQRQRVWLAMALAQETPLLLLDEPTTFLDIAHQMEVLDLCAEMHRGGRTLVAVLHDLNHACRCANHLVVMREGAVVAQGPPDEIVNAELVERVFGLECLVVPCPATGAPMVVPAQPARRGPRLMSGLERFPRRSGIARLAARRQLTPRMIRVTLVCEGFHDDWPIQQPGEIITLLFVPPGEEIVLPLTGWRFPDDAPEQEWRNYTVRRHDREAP